jgi:lipoate-protein ligase A
MELHEVDYKVPNGKLLRLRAQVAGDKIRSVTITGDFFLHPEERIAELEKVLAGKKLEKVTLQKTVSQTLSGCQMVGVSPEEFVNALLRLQKDSL